MRMRKLFADAIFTGEGELLTNHLLVINPEGFIEDLLPCNKEDVPVDAHVLQGILCPGFVNAHCHLELSWMRGKFSGMQGINDFIQKITSLEAVSETEKVEAMQLAEQEMKRNGIVAVADISNTALSFSVKDASSLFYYTFVELFGSKPEISEAVFEKGQSILETLKKNKRNKSGHLVPHSPYSLSRSLLNSLSAYCMEHPGLISIHHQESESENQLFTDQKGLMLERLHAMGLGADADIFNGQRPWQLVEKYFSGKFPVLFVHNTFSEAQDIECIQNAFGQAWFCLCPKSNLYIENRLPDLPLFENYPECIVLGTDSLASNSSLSVFEEIRTLKEAYPQVGIDTLLSWATANGAKMLGLENQIGKFEKGKSPGVNLIKGFDLENELFRNGAEVCPIIECNAFKP